MATISSPKAWVMAARPKTLPAAVVPVLVGTAVAVADGVFAPVAAVAALVGAMLIQIGTNLANDYFDYKSGADNEDRLGPTRVTQAGLLAESAVRNAMILTFLASAMVGSYLIWVGGWPILVVGILSILSGIAYTGGPYPLGYHGLGDLFVFIFFGVVAVCGTYWVQALDWSWMAFAASLPVGFLSVAILVVNNYRDLETDRRAGKNTLAVRLGPEATRWQWLLLVGGAFAVPVVQVALGATPWLLLAFGAAPYAVVVARRFLTSTGRDLNPVLASTAKTLVLFGLLYSGGWMLG
jgi:1,4-dihydroxy-2-naphthoate octaprenyltransferase